MLAQQVFSWSVVSAFGALAAAHLLAVASPGPAFVATLQVSVTQRRSRAMAQSFGLGTAALVWATGALTGMQAVLLELSGLYRFMQLAGGLYLCWVGWQSWRHAADRMPESGADIPALTVWQAYRRGFATNIANPKVMIFFASIFVALLPADWPTALRLAVLLMVACNETAWYAGLAWLLSMPRCQRAYASAKTAIDRSAGAVMILFGGRLLWGAWRTSRGRA